MDIEDPLAARIHSSSSKNKSNLISML